MPFLPPNQQHQSTEDKKVLRHMHTLFSVCAKPTCQIEACSGKVLRIAALCHVPTHSLLEVVERFCNQVLLQAELCRQPLNTLPAWFIQ